MKRQLWIALSLLLTLVSCDTGVDWRRQTEQVLRDMTMENAAWALEQQPETITAFPCERSQGGVHDFYSEGDYWWPDLQHPDGPYIRKDGQTNPDNFVAHRLAMIRFSKVVGYLASAYLVTGQKRYVDHALLHIRAWFVDPRTRMNPSLDYAQAIKGITPGRGIGIIDTIHLMEVAQAIRRMQGEMDADTLAAVIRWFEEYITWLTTSSNGLDEMSTKNNHATCWVMQTAVFAKLTGNESVLEMCRDRYKEVLLPRQMASDGSFPLELERTKPYGYSLFNLDAMATICQVLSDKEENLWTYQTPDGRNLRQAIRFMELYVQDKSSWPYSPDVMYWEEWPVAHPAYLFGAIAYGDENYFKLWARLPHKIAEGEVERNVPVRNPLIWIE